MRFALVVTAMVSATLLLNCGAAAGQQESTKRDWPINGGEPNNTHFSPLTQINRENVGQLRVAWSYDTGETGGLQTSPIIEQIIA